MGGLVINCFATQFLMQPLPFDPKPVISLRLLRQNLDDHFRNFKMPLRASLDEKNEMVITVLPGLYNARADDVCRYVNNLLAGLPLKLRINYAELERSDVKC